MPLQPARNASRALRFIISLVALLCLPVVVHATGLPLQSGATFTVPKSSVDLAPVEYDADDDSKTVSAPVVPETEPEPDAASGYFNMLDRSRPSRFWLSAQSNIIDQYHPTIHSPYRGPKSFTATPEQKLSIMDSLYADYAFAPHTDAFLTVERFDGSGLSKGQGLAGFTNLDVVRNPSLGGVFYIARLGLHTVIPLSHRLVPVDRGPMQPASLLPERRLELRVGKFSVADFFNNNAEASDSHKQFLNWTVDNDGTYDYAADTRGYTNSAMVDYESPHLAARVMESMMPIQANGPKLDWDILRSHSESCELELRNHLFYGKPGTVRLLGFMNHANMGLYSLALKDYEAGRTPVPDVMHTDRRGGVKYGFGLNLEQEVLDGVTLFSRLGWNEGRHESFTYTEVNNTGVFGVGVQGKHWKRKEDKLGVAFVSNGISTEHRRYLEKGGTGFILGDGRLRYGRENIVELYYTCHLWKGVYAGPDFQVIQNPGYNRSRGPVPVLSLRAHVDI